MRFVVLLFFGPVLSEAFFVDRCAKSAESFVCPSPACSSFSSLGDEEPVKSDDGFGSLEIAAARATCINSLAEGSERVVT